MPLRLHETTIDHVLPESLLDDDDQLQKVLAEYGLPKDFKINGYENWLPCHAGCNEEKGNTILEYVPGNKTIIDRLRLRAHNVERTALSVSSNINKDRVFNTIFSALERQVIGLRDLDAWISAFIYEPGKVGVPDDYTLLDSGYLIRSEQIVREGLCCCERESRVGQSQKVYCYFQDKLSPWVIRKGLYFKCYDEVISCPRCSARHIRGHVGRAVSAKNLTPTKIPKLIDRRRSASASAWRPSLRNHAVTSKRE